MKQKLLNNFRLRVTLLVALLCAAFTGAQADTYTLGWGSASGDDGTYTNFESVSGSVSNIVSFSTAKNSSSTAPAYNSNSHELRLYYNSSGAGGSITLTPAKGVTITGFVMTTSTTPSVKYKVNGGTATSVTVSSNTYTVTNISATSSLEIQNVNTSNTQLRIKTIQITYTTSGGGSSLSNSNLALTGAPVALNFDLYNNSDAQVINFTTSSTGAVTVSESDYITTLVDTVNKTITVTPKTSVTPSAQTITVNQAADSTYKAGSVTFTVTVTDSTPIPTHTATFSINNVPAIQDFEEGDTITFPSDPENIYGKKFVGWVTEAIEGTTDKAPAFVTTATMGTSDVTYYAVFAAVTPGTVVNKTDSLTTSTFGSPSTYTTWSGKSATNGSTAVYAGNSTTNNSNIQIRSTSPSGIITTTTGGKAKKITVKWASNTSKGRTLDVYGRNTAYTKVDSLYGTAVQRGTLIGSIIKDSTTVLAITGDYAFIGMRSNDGAMYIEKISIDWDGGTPATYSGYCTTVEAVAVVKPEITVAENPFLFSTTATITCETEGAAIKYSYDGENWSDYTAALTITETKTIYAKATKDANESTVAQVTATKNLATPIVTIDATGITNTNVFTSTDAGSLAATVSYNDAAIDGAAVTWTSNKNEVATINETTGAVTLVAAGSVTFTATYAGNGDYSEKTATYNMTVTNIDPNAPGTENNPYTVAEAIAATPSSGTSANVYIHGIVSSFQNTSIVGDGSNYRYYISDDGTTTGQLLVYKGKGLNEVAFSDANDLQLGDEVVIYGGLTIYNKTKEVAANNYIISLLRKSTSDLAKKGNITLDFKNAATTANVADYVSSTSTGTYAYESADTTIAKVTDGGVVTAMAVGETTITVSQAADAAYKAGSVEITVTVADTRVAATTIPAINISNLKEGDPQGTVSVVDPVKADEGVTFNFTSSEPSVLSIEGTTYTVGAVGTTTVTVTATPSNTNLYTSVEANFEVTVEFATKSDNTITKDFAEYTTVYGTPLVGSVSASVGYDGVIEAASSNEKIATVSIAGDEITVTPVAVGTVTITLTAAETITFNAAENVAFDVTITATEGEEKAPSASVALFSETFDKCEGNGGHDGSYTGSVGTSSTSDLLDEVWETIGDNGAYQCIKLGTTKAYGTVVTSKIALTGNGTLTFSAAGWGDTNTNKLYVTATGAELSGDTLVTLVASTWNNYTVNISKANGEVAITFSMKRGFLDDVVVMSTAVDITAKLNAYGFATFSTQYPLDFSDWATADYSAWEVTGISGDEITFNRLKGKIKGGQGIMLKGEPSATVTLTSSDSDAELTENKLVGTHVPTFLVQDDGVNINYALSGNTLKKVTSAGAVCPAGKAYLPIPKTLSVKSLTFVFEDNETGIDEVVKSQRTSDDDKIYNLAGQRVAKAQKGLYIVNGKKVFIKK